MHLPAEICAQITGEIRQWNDRFAEEKALGNLSVVARYWRAEALRALWSKVVIDDADTGKAEPRGTIRMVGLIVEKGLAPNIDDLTIDLNMESYLEEIRYRNRAFPLQNKIIHILYTAVNVRRLMIKNSKLGGLRILPHLFLCRFPLLRKLKLHLCLPEEEQDDYGEIKYRHLIEEPDGYLPFFVNHPQVTELTFHVFSGEKVVYDIIQLPWLRSKQSTTDILPNLTKFIGVPEAAKFLRAGESLREMILWVNPQAIGDYDYDWFLRDLGHLDKPFPNVRRLGFKSSSGPFFSEEVLEAIGSCFPNVEHLDGLDIDQYFVDDLLEPDYVFKPYLCKLKELRYYAIERAPVHTSFRRVKRAMEKFPELFPSIESAVRSSKPMKLPVGQRRSPHKASRIHLRFK
ncbi:hypothetical protein SISNIDRAFT_482280 [Sistotremastrum niveocremeum HHB9708]|uniref:F-box domain-containing protein n=1 Tax=Sistotremastrum niveocremeum HHB9708 TaxID=1314777 RepID=A0A164YYW3_9AGAM|nr:hypothetical protein SISNIDRAFT_482280 [Sistotremastrum niveocremeum HHB9708]